LLTETYLPSLTIGTCECTVCSRRGHECPEGGEQIYSSNFVYLGARGGRVVKTTLRPLYSREGPQHPL